MHSQVSSVLLSYDAPKRLSVATFPDCAAALGSGLDYPFLILCLPCCNLFSLLMACILSSISIDDSVNSDV